MTVNISKKNEIHLSFLPYWPKTKISENFKKYYANIRENSMITFMEMILTHTDKTPRKIVKTQYQKRNKSYEMNICKSKT